MKVLILGGSGFIGLPAAQAFARNGHEVYAQTRDASKAKLLEAEELIPVVADPAKPSEWAEIAAKVDIVMDCTGGSDLKALSATILETSIEAAKKGRGSSGTKLTFIYCSGAWVHGEDRENFTSERSVPKNTVKIVDWRPAFEQRVIASTEVDGIVVRPALTYGRSGSLLGLLFTQAAQGKIEWPGTKGGRMGLVHTDDLATLFVLVAEAAPICKGLVIDAANDFNESVDDIIEVTAKVAGVATWSYRAPANLFEEAMSTSVILRSSLARALVGWRPLKAGLADGIKTYYKSWQVSAQGIPNRAADAQ